MNLENIHNHVETLVAAEINRYAQEQEADLDQA